MRCKRCDRQLSDNQSYEYQGETLCEDCYVDRYRPSITACDPLGSSCSYSLQEEAGAGRCPQGLTDQQRAMYEFVKSQGKATGEEIMQKFNLTDSQMQSQLAILRHCELVKGHKEGNKI